MKNLLKLKWLVIFLPLFCSSFTLANSSLTTVAKGDFHNCVISERTVYCWGKNARGQLGLGDNPDRVGLGDHPDRDSPTRLDGLPAIKTIVADFSSTFAIDFEGHVWAWGENEERNLGLGNGLIRVIKPTRIPELSGIMSITALFEHTFAVDSEGSVWAWGTNFSHQLGLGHNNVMSKPAQIKGLPPIEALAAGSYFTLALDRDGNVWGWGVNAHGQLGTGGTDIVVSPTQIQGLTNIRSLAVGLDFSLALDHDGNIWAFGGNSSGQLGLGDNINRATPTQIPELNSIHTIRSSPLSKGALALDSNGQVWAWGRVNSNDPTNRLRPIPIENMPKIIDLSTSSTHSLALDEFGEVWAWGGNFSGELGLGHKESQTTPVRILGLPPISFIMALDEQSVMITEDEQMYMSGSVVEKTSPMLLLLLNEPLRVDFPSKRSGIKSGASFGRNALEN